MNVAKDDVSAQAQSADGKVAALNAQIALLQKTVAELGGKLAVYEATPAPGVVVKMRMPRVIGGKHFASGSAIGTFIPVEGVSPAEAEIAIRSHKTDFGSKG